MTATIYHKRACGTSPNVLGLIRNSGEEPQVIDERGRRIAPGSAA